MTVTVTSQSVDLLVGAAVLACGLAALRFRSSRTGPLLLVWAGAWFLGSLLPVAVSLHRGAVSHVVLSYPTGRLGRRGSRVLVVATYVGSLAAAATHRTVLTLASGVLLAAVAVWSLAAVPARARRARIPSAALTVALGGCLALAAANSWLSWREGAPILAAYDGLIVLTAVSALVGLSRAPGVQAAVATLISELGPTSVGLTRELARATGDPSLKIGYYLPERGGYVDDLGRPVAPPRQPHIRVETGGSAPGAHALVALDPAVLADATLTGAIAAVTRLAATNARIQADIHSRMNDVQRSQRSLVMAEDTERARLADDLEQGPHARLAQARLALAAASSPPGGLTHVLSEIDGLTEELRALALGARPASLQRGLAAAIVDMTRYSPIPISTDLCPDTVPVSIESTLYFVCAEALANITKHAGATSATINLRAQPGSWILEVDDDGVGGADPNGPGLRRLAARVESRGGNLRLSNSPTGGTRVTVVVTRPFSESGAAS